MATISGGHSYIPDVPDSDVEALLARGRLRATTDFTELAHIDTVNICVPTPLRKTKDPDMSYVVAAVETIASRLRPGMLVILESTTYSGTTEELVRPILERGGLVAGRDFFLAFFPGRVDPGNQRFNTRNVPKVVGRHAGVRLARGRAVQRGNRPCGVCQLAACRGNGEAPREHAIRRPRRTFSGSEHRLSRIRRRLRPADRQCRRLSRQSQRCGSCGR